MTNYLTAAVFALLSVSAIAADAPAAATARYVQTAGGNSLTVTFVQEGAATEAKFGKFSTVLVYDAANPAAGKLDVKVDAGSISTEMDDRDREIRGENIFSVVKFPQVEYHAASFAKSASGALEAVGKLTVRGVTHDLRVPLAIKPVTLAGKPGFELTGSVSVKRLDYGVGQGEWSATDSVENAVKLQWNVRVEKAPG